MLKGGWFQGMLRPMNVSLLLIFLIDMFLEIGINQHRDTLASLSRSLDLMKTWFHSECGFYEKGYPI